MNHLSKILRDHWSRVTVAGITALGVLGSCGSDVMAQCVQGWDDSSNWSTDDPGKTFGVFDDGLGGGPALYFGGHGEFVGGVNVDRIAKWDGIAWTPLEDGLHGDNTNGSGSVWAILPHDDGSGLALYVGGKFEIAGNEPGIIALRIARWDGTSWSSVGIGFNTRVTALAEYDDSKWGGLALYAGGSFYITVRKVIVNGIAKWDGETSSALGDGVGGMAEPGLNALQGFDDGNGPELFVTGSFLTAGGVEASYIAKWDGTSWSPVGNGLDDLGEAFLVYDHDGDGVESLIVGGRFLMAGGVVVNGVAAWDGVEWSALGEGIDDVGGVGDFAAFDDGGGGGTNLYAVGSFPGGNIAKWDGSTWEPLGAGLDGSAAGLQVFDDGSGGGPDLYVTGLFGQAGGNPSDKIARWNGCAASCAWDLDNNGSVGASDLLSLLANWGPCKGCPADFDGNGTVGASDLLALLANWGPCP